MRNHLLGLLGLLALAGCGDDSSTTASAPVVKVKTAAEAPGGTPFPDAVGGALHAGTTYTTRRFTPHLKITPPPGRWVAEIG